MTKTVVNKTRDLLTSAPFLLIMMAGLTILVAAAYNIYFERSGMERVEGQLESITHLKVAELVQWRLERLGDGQVFHGNPGFTELVGQYAHNREDAASLSHLINWLRHIRESYSYDRVFLFDSSAVQLAAWPVEGAGDPVIAGAILTNPRMEASDFLDFYRNPADDRIYLSVLAPVQGASADFVLALRIDPEQFLYPYLNRWPVYSRTAETLLVRRDGDEVVYLNQLRFRQDIALELRLPIAQDSRIPSVRAVLGDTGIFIGQDYRSIPVLSALAPVDNSPWYLVNRMYLEEVYGYTRDRRLIMAILMLALLGAEFTGVLATTRRWELTSLEKEAEAARSIKASEQRLRRILDEMMEGCQILSCDWRFQYLNDTAVLYSRFRREDLIGKTLFECYPGIQDTDLFAVLDACMKSRKAETTESEFRFPDGTRDWFQFNIQPIWEGLFILTLNISDRKRHEQKLLELNRNLEQMVEDRTAILQVKNRELEAFTYTVAHDLRAPLRGIDGFTRILQEEYAEALGAEGGRLLDVVRMGAVKLDRLIANLLEYARSGRSLPVVVEVDMGKLARSAYADCADPSLLETFQVSFGELPDAIADQGMMERIWTNLLSNAVKYSTPSAVHRIEIEGQKHKDHIEYSVRDHGVGFDQRYSDKLFGMFQRLHSEEDFPGSGIGLAVVRKLVELHGGTIQAEGEKGKGAIFRFSLPERSLK
jgi:PAS domain S-box-containing protein